MPVWDLALILAAVVFLFDVAVRRLALDWSSLFRREVVEAPETTLAGRVSSSDSTERVAKARGVEGRMTTPRSIRQPHRMSRRPKIPQNQSPPTALRPCSVCWMPNEKSSRGRRMNSPEHKLVNAWRSEVERHIVGDPAPVTELMLTLLAGGHALLESAPGLGKTTLVRTVAIAAGLDLGRVQCTPDLMPMDVTGGDVVLPEQSNTPGAVVFRPGPIFHQVVLADELNRATPRTQSAMLEAMQEGTVTSAGVTRPLPEPFHVLATQNPIEQEGTWPLPEAQLDRFLTMIRIPTPDAKAGRDHTGHHREHAVARSGDGTRRSVGVAGRGSTHLWWPLRFGIGRPVWFLPPTPTELAPKELGNDIECGASPRAGQALLGMAKALAFLEGRSHIGMVDLRRVARPVLRHRLFPTFEFVAREGDMDLVVDDLVRSVPREHAA